MKCYTAREKWVAHGKVKSAPVLNRVYPDLPDFGKYMMSHARLGRSGRE